jgi:hypothetical protein
MDLSERNDSETEYNDAPGTRAMAKGSLALMAGMTLGLIAFVLAAFGLLPALLLLLVAVPLGRWGSKKLKANESRLPPSA